MLRTLLAHKLPLHYTSPMAATVTKMLRRPTLVRTAPMAQQVVCEFSTTATPPSHSQQQQQQQQQHAPNKKHKKETAKTKDDASSLSVTHQKKNTPMRSPWDSFFHTGFDDLITRDPFFNSFFKGQDPFERMRQHMRMMPVLQSRSTLSPSGTTTTRPTTSRLVRASPGYEIKEHEGHYEIALDIPKGLETKDLKVELERDGTIVHVSGERRDTTDTVDSVTRFSKRFSIGEGVDTEQLQANFADGYLVIKAPKLVVEEIKRQIPITNQPHVEKTHEELRQENYSDAFDESDWAEVGKKAA